MTGPGRRSAVAGFSLLLAAGLAVSGCGGGSSSTSATSACPAKTGKAVTASNPVAPSGKPAAGWTLPGADLANTRDVASTITSANVAKLGVAWTVPLHTSLSHTDGAYATTPVIVNGVVYVQDLQSNVMAISLATGQVLWTHTYNSPNGGPDGVNMVGGVVYGATNRAAFALDAQTGRLLWKLPVGGHQGHENDGQLTENAKPGSHAGLPAKFCLEPSIFGGIETQLASNGSTTFAAVNDLALPASRTGYTAGVAADLAAVEKAAGEMVAVNQDTGTVEWDTPIPSSPYGAATVTNDVVFTTTFDGDLYALDAGTGKILMKTPLSAGTNAPVAVDGDYVIAGAGFSLVPSQKRMIIAYKLGATGKLPDTVAS